MKPIITKLWTWIDDKLDLTYRPEKHFMRGPGPKARRKLEAGKR